jgi:hypothetical protein
MAFLSGRGLLGPVRFVGHFIETFMDHPIVECILLSYAQFLRIQFGARLTYAWQDVDAVRVPQLLAQFHLQESVFRARYVPSTWLADPDHT